MGANTIGAGAAIGDEGTLATRDASLGLLQHI
jgi:hypothetical protein